MRNITFLREIKTQYKATLDHKVKDEIPRLYSSFY